MIKMTTTYISLGCNQGVRIENLHKAMLEIQKKVGAIKKASSIYETPAWGFEGPDFLNACLCIHTELSSEELLTQLLEIEISMGRVRSSELKYTSRSIDLDVLFYADQIISTEILTVPHPRLALRNFILFPMAEIAPDWVDPKSEKTILELLSASPDESIPKKIGEELSVKE